MELANLVVPGGAYSLCCAAIWFACKRTDALLSPEGRKRVASWLKSSAQKDRRQSSAKIFAILFTVFFGKKVFSVGFLCRVVAISAIWLLLLISIFYTNIAAPYFIHFAWPKTISQHSYGSFLSDTFGALVFDADYKYVMPILTPLTYFILCNFVADFATIVGCYYIFRAMLVRDKARYYAIAPIGAFGLAALSSFTFILLAHVVILLYVGRLYEQGLSGVITMTIDSYKYAARFPHGPPFQEYHAIPVLSTTMTFCWMLLFIFSALAVKSAISFLNLIGAISPLMDIGRKPMQVVGWMMIVVITPLFWVVSFIKSDFTYWIGLS